MEYRGDGECNCGETCTSCQTDCGSCDAAPPTTNISVKRKSNSENVTNLFLRPDTYTIEFTDADNVGGSGLKTCQYKIYSCDSNGENCTEKEPLTNRTCNGSLERILGPSTSYNLDNGWRYLIYSLVTDNADNDSTPAYQYLRTDFTPPTTEIK